MDKHVCDHLRPVEDLLASLGCPIEGAGQPWSMNCRFWIQYPVVFDCESLMKRLNLDACVEIHINDDPRSGREKGLVCSSDHDGIIGRHPADGAALKVVS
jgi:hypothetical protein